MDGLLSLLFFAFLFYLMMRMGCGSHMTHGDPVCHMVVNQDVGYGMMYEGRLYRFCSRNCLDKFDNNPLQYLNQTEE